MTVVHVVLLKFTPETPEATIKKALEDAAALQQTCIHPATSRPYIKSFKAGKDHSPEGLQKGFTHLFVMEFENAADRDYYIGPDPTHQVYKNFLEGIPVGEVQVLDFTDGCY